MNIYTPYVYLIGWTSHDQYYIGSRYANSARGIANPAELWQLYYTSSEHVKQFREENGEPDIIMIRKTFSNATDAYNYETKILRRLNARDHPKLLNRSNNEIPCADGPLSDFTKKKMSVAKIGKKMPPRSPEWCAKISASLTGRVGKPQSAESNRKRSESQKGKKMPPRSDEWKKKQSLAQTGKKQSEETKQKKAESLKGRKKPSFSKEHRENIAIALTGKKRGPLSDETKQKIRETKILRNQQKRLSHPCPA